MSEIHRRIGIVVETLGDLEALIQAGRAEGYDADEPIANNRNGNNPIYIYFERGSNKPAPPEHPATHEGRCPECLQTVPANESGRALLHYRGETTHPDAACYGVGKIVRALVARK